jgi:hypothetical protein
MRGIYRFYQNGELVGESENLITTEGKRLILRYLAGQAPDLGGAIGLGAGSAAATLTDTRLTYEVDRAIVTLKNADYTNSVVIFKTTIPQEAVYKIYEACLWSTANNSLNPDYSSRVLTTFDLDVEPWTNATLDATVARTSLDSVRVDAGSNATVSTRLQAALDLAGYSNNDVFLLAFNKVNANITDLTLAFENETGGAFKMTQSIAALPTGYNILAFAKSGFAATGSIAWSAITKFGVDVKAGATAGYVVLDGLRIEDTDSLNQDYVLVSRSVLGTPLTKTAIAPMDIEYALEFNIT